MRPEPFAFLIMAFACVQSATGQISAGGPLKLDSDEAVDRERWLDDPRVHESSGLAISHRQPGHVWTINDSGDRPRLYAFDDRGKFTGSLEFISGVKAKDWEDMAGFLESGVSRLLVADCGDNDCRRESVSLILFDEPAPNQSKRVSASDNPSVQQIHIRYPDGAKDCEAIAVDVQKRQIYLFTKSFLPHCKVYQTHLPRRGDTVTNEVVVAKPVTTFPVPMVTGADLNPRTGELWLCNYFLAFRFPNRHQVNGKPPSRTGLSLAEQLSQTPEPVALPAWKQIEAIAIDHSGDVWVTSEGMPAPMGRLTCLKSNKNSESNPSTP